MAPLAPGVNVAGSSSVESADARQPVRRVRPVAEVGNGRTPGVPAATEFGELTQRTAAKGWLIRKQGHLRPFGRSRCPRCKTFSWGVRSIRPRGQLPQANRSALAIDRRMAPSVEGHGSAVQASSSRLHSTRRAFT